MTSDARREIGEYVCSRYGCGVVSSVLTEMGGMCPEHASPLLFPIQRPSRKPGSERLPDFVPWEFMKPHEARARRNHQQTLARLAERGGVDVTEALAILQDRGFSDDVNWTRDTNEFLALLREWRP